MKGEARAFEADRRRVTLTDVVPENGELVLSLHAVTGLRLPVWPRRHLRAHWAPACSATARINPKIAPPTPILRRKTASHGLPAEGGP